MAVMYSKLGDCLGDTANVGPLAKTRPLCLGQRFAGKVHDPLWLGSSVEDPWGSLLGVGGKPSLDLVLSAWEAMLFP